LFAKVRYFGSKIISHNFLNPFLIVFLLQLPVEISRIIVGPYVLLDKGIFDLYFNIAVSMTSLTLLCDFIILYLSWKISSRIKLISETLNYKIRPTKMLLAGIFFYVLFFIFLLLLSSHSFGFINWIMNPRIGYQLHRTGAGQYWVFAISTLSVSFSLFCIYTKSLIRLFLLFLFTISSAYMLGSKAIILDFFIFFLIILWLRKFKYFKLMTLIGIPVAMLVMLLNFFGGNLNSFDSLELFSYFDYYKNSAQFFEDYYKGKIELFHGKIFISDFWNLLPRSLFPDKPYSYGITLVNEIYWPGAAEETNTPAFGGPVAYFADFGILGVILFSLLNPFKFISYLFFWQLVKNYSYESIKNNSVILALFILFSSPVFLMNLSFPINLIFYFIIILIIMFYNRIVVK
jgi:hypothetical protein